MAPSFFEVVINLDGLSFVPDITCCCPNLPTLRRASSRFGRRGLKVSFDVSNSQFKEKPPQVEILSHELFDLSISFWIEANLSHFGEWAMV